VLSGVKFMVYMVYKVLVLLCDGVSSYNALKMMQLVETPTFVGLGCLL
jgi:hypothetical protein